MNREILADCSTDPTVASRSPCATARASHRTASFQPSEWFRRRPRTVVSFATAPLFLLVCGVIGCGKTRESPDEAVSAGGAGATTGVAGAGGEAGTAGADGDSVEWTPLTVDRLDLLLVVDNSSGMQLKQNLLSSAIPRLLDGLTRYRCLSMTDPSADVVVRDDPSCPAGYALAGRPLTDIHLGVITSSLGAYGGDYCSRSREDTTPNGNDHGYLLPFVRTGLPSWNSQGFLTWSPGTEAEALATLTRDFQDHVLAAGVQGCGFEATFESWYRFLADPHPVEVIDIDDGQVVLGDVDQVLLAQRAAFTRPDSLLGVLMLSDENDCSVNALADAYRMTSTAPLPLATSACDEDPNSDCCFSCDADSAPKDCLSASDDSACDQDSIPPVNLRCWDQKRRFGRDFLHPISRYVAALRNERLSEDCREPPCAERENPLYARPPGLARRASRIVVGGILGVPWQDLATDDTLEGSELRYRRAQDLDWLPLVGDPSLAEWPAPEDPFLIESVEPRRGTHPRTAEDIAPADSLLPLVNSINGHERQALPTTDELQATCLFPLDEPISCENREGCPCTDQATLENDPRCQPPDGGAAGTIQYFADAKPSQRQLGLLYEMSEDAVVASACPKTAIDEGSNGGYEPAMRALLLELSTHLAGPCSPGLDVNSQGQVACRVVEAVPQSSDCKRAGRTDVSPALTADVLEMLAAARYCGTPTSDSCAEFTICEVEQLEGAANARCRTEADPMAAGFCFIDDDSQKNSPFTSHCLEVARHRVRLVGTLEPGAHAFYTCD